MLFWIFIAASVCGAAWCCVHFGWYLGVLSLWKPVLTAMGLFAALVLAFVILVVVSAAVVDRSKPSQRYSAYYRWLAQEIISLGLVFSRVHVHGTGVQNVPKQGRYLLVVNHLFNLDPAVCLQVLKHERLAFVSKKENEKIPIVGQVMHKILCLSIDRENDRAALKTIVKASQYLKEDKTSIAIFPEGYVSKTGVLQPFRNGAFKIAQKAQVPVVVGVLTNTKAILKNMFRRRCDVYFDILQTIPASQVQSLSSKELGDQVRSIMEAGIAARAAAMHGA